jgi:DNA-binding NtrC family response regulator
MPAPKVKFSSKVLIVDEEEGIRESLKLILSDHYDLILTDSAEQALRCLDKDPTIGLALIGIKTPKANNLEMLKNIKNERPGLNVIILTNDKSAETVNEAASLGASGHIVKPFKSDEILDTVRTYIAFTPNTKE